MSPEESLYERKALLDRALDAVILAPHVMIDESSPHEDFTTVHGMVMNLMEAQKCYEQALLHAASVAPSHEVSEDYTREAEELGSNVLFFVKTLAAHKARQTVQ
jgi:hypothetical protein